MHNDMQRGMMGHMDYGEDLWGNQAKPVQRNYDECTTLLRRGQAALKGC
jgi:hypothetical protein